MLILSKSCSVQSNIQQSTKHDLVLLLCSGFVPAGTAECVLCLKILSRKGTLLGLVCDETTWPLECLSMTRQRHGWINNLILVKKLKCSSAVQYLESCLIRSLAERYLYFLCASYQHNFLYGKDYWLQTLAFYSFWKKW